MRATTTPTGIPAVGHVPWGAHFCQFYRTTDDLVSALVPFFEAGLDNDERCLWVTSDPLPAAEAATALARHRADLADCVARGRIRIVDHASWYLERSGSAKGGSVLGAWFEHETRALDEGYRGLRLTGNTYWLERADWRTFSEYEALVNRAFASRRIVALCSYSLDRCNPAEILDVVKNHQFALVRTDGEWQVIESASLRIAKDELVRLNDELERRVAERTRELQAALEARDEFLCVASHELKTPMTTLQLQVEGLSRLTQRGALSPEDLQRRLGKALDQCKRIERLVNRLLDVSRASAGGPSLSLEPGVDLGRITSVTLERFGEEARRAGCTLRFAAPVEPVTGRWDPMRLEQVVSNLVSNAIKYAPGAPIDVVVSGEATTATLEVRDHGPGIDGEQHPRLFEKFSRASTSPVGGFGLGLWIVRAIAEALGGTVKVASRRGAGACFTISLPRER